MATARLGQMVTLSPRRLAEQPLRGSCSKLRMNKQAEGFCKLEADSSDFEHLTPVASESDSIRSNLTLD
jgi:hypothetical protein